MESFNSCLLQSTDVSINGESCSVVSSRETSRVTGWGEFSPLGYFYIEYFLQGNSRVLKLTKHGFENLLGDLNNPLDDALTKKSSGHPDRRERKK
jgi:hypothetical protein